jgi:hypothetical protein
MWNKYFPIYERLEREFCELTYAVALEDAHLNVYSILMSEFLLRICSECENISKTLLKDLEPSARNIKDKNFPTLGKELHAHVNFEIKEIEVIWLYQSLTILKIKPFEGWKVGNPAWYTAYNELKHDRDANFAKANYKNCLYALGGLFILNLWLRKDSIESQPSSFSIEGEPGLHKSFAKQKVFSYSKLFSPDAFLTPNYHVTNSPLVLTDYDF